MKPASAQKNHVQRFTLGVAVVLLARPGSRPAARRAKYRHLFALLQETRTQISSMNAGEDSV